MFFTEKGYEYESLQKTKILSLPIQCVSFNRYPRLFMEELYIR